MAGVSREGPGRADGPARAEGCDPARLDRIEREILRAVRSIRYGSVEITIHEARVVQIERKEKVRLKPDGSKDAA